MLALLLSTQKYFSFPETPKKPNKLNKCRWYIFLPDEKRCLVFVFRQREPVDSQHRGGVQLHAENRQSVAFTLLPTTILNQSITSTNKPVQPNPSIHLSTYDVILPLFVSFRRHRAVKVLQLHLVLLLLLLQRKQESGQVRHRAAARLAFERGYRLFF